MPLIRYDIGDIAIKAEKGKENCSCGRGMPLIKSVRGRDVNLFKTKKNELIDGEYFTHLFYLKAWCKKFQVVQKDYEKIVVNVIIDNALEKQFMKDKEEIERNIKLVMGNDCIVIFNPVDSIPPTKEGKFLYTISELNNER